MKDFWEETENENVKKKINKKKIIIISIIAIILIAVITLAIVYTKNQQAREWIDINKQENGLIKTYLEKK